MDHTESEIRMISKAERDVEFARELKITPSYGPDGSCYADRVAVRYHHAKHPNVQAAVA